MKRAVYYFIIGLCLLSSVSAEKLYIADSLTLDVDVQSELKIVNLEELHLFLYDFPKQTDRQQIISRQTDPIGTVLDASIDYYLAQPPELLTYHVKSRVVRQVDEAQITETIQQGFNVPEELQKYVQSTKYIDSDDPSIKLKAEEIVNGDEAMIALFKLAGWVEENVEYDISTLTEKVTQKSSWVLENRKGVCDEMTSLFVAMARSLVMPARFVSGVAYTTADEFDDNWMPHSWAEVYVQGVWVPFDLVYGELGYVDPTHIRFVDSVDAQTPSIAVFAEGSGTFEEQPLHFTVDVVDEGVPSEARVGFDVMYTDGLQISVENKNDYYAATTLTLGAPPEVSLDEETIHVYLKPREKKEIRVEVIPRFDDDSTTVQTFQVDVYNERNEQKSVLIDESVAETVVSASVTREPPGLLWRLMIFAGRFLKALVS